MDMRNTTIYFYFGTAWREANFNVPAASAAEARAAAWNLMCKLYPEETEGCVYSHGITFLNPVYGPAGRRLGNRPWPKAKAPQRN